MEKTPLHLNKIADYLYEIPRTGRMSVPGRVFGDDRVLRDAAEDQALQQVANVAHLPGIVAASIAMPDIHWGYGFPIGGVAATDPKQGGVISPGGVGYDINCGVRLARTNLEESDLKQNLQKLVQQLFRDIPTGVGSHGAISKLKVSEEKEMLRKGSRWAVHHGYGTTDDIERTEEQGCLRGADPDAVSDRALKRGAGQVGTLGSGNHFLEIGIVDQVYDQAAAGVFDLHQGQITLMIHCGSRGFGHQVCGDFLKQMSRSPAEFDLPDRQLACARIESPGGRQYLAAMACAANFAWANRQCIFSLSRQSFEKALSVSPRALGMTLVYDVCHNIAKMEEHSIGDIRKHLCVHRKGATRAFPAGHPDVPALYRNVGQPVLIPGDMGRYSFVCVGQPKSMDETFGSTAHGAGRVMSRRQAIREGRGRRIDRELGKRGIIVMAAGRETLAEEMSEAYKDVSQVVQIMHDAGVAKKVVRLRPIGVIKG